MRQAGYLADILCAKENISRHSSFLGQWIDAGNSIDCLINTLIDLERSAKYDYILIGEDPLLWHIAMQPVNELTHLLPVHPPHTRSILEKIHFAPLCKSIGICTPEFFVIQSLDDVQAAIHRLGFPLITKVNYSFAGKGVRVFDDQAALMSYIGTYPFAQPLLAQRYIKSEVISVEALFCKGRLLEYICSEAIDIGLGPSTKRRYMPRITEVGVMLERLGKTTELHGFFNVTLLREIASGKLFLIEADPRPNKWFAYAHWFGANFAYAFRLFMSKDELADAPFLNRAAEAAVTHWDMQHFDSHYLKLLHTGQTLESINHLLDFDTTLRYCLHDPALLREKTLRIRKHCGFLTGGADL